MSQNIGLAPSSKIDVFVAMKVNGVVKISSPGEMSNAFNAIFKALVPLVQAVT